MLEKSKLNKTLFLIISLSLSFYLYSEAQAKNQLFSSPPKTKQNYFFSLAPFKKSFSESLKPEFNLKDLAQVLTFPIQTFQNTERLFRKQFNANPVCFSQGGAPSFPPGRSFPAALCYDTPKQGCNSCACRCGYVGYIWDPITSICGCAQ